MLLYTKELSIVTKFESQFIKFKNVDDYIEYLQKPPSTFFKGEFFLSKIEIFLINLYIYFCEKHISYKWFSVWNCLDFFVFGDETKKER